MTNTPITRTTRRIILGCCAVLIVGGIVAKLRYENHMQDMAQSEWLAARRAK